MITKKLLTDDLKFSRSQGKVHLKYKNKQLAVVSETVLFQLLLDAAPQSFINELAKFAGVKTQTSEIPQGVLKMATVYSFERLKRLGKKPTSLTDEKVISLTDTMLKDKKNVVAFKQAIQVMRDAEMKDINKFIQAQIDGLQFVNDGAGVFPSPQQLGTSKALERVFNYTASSVTPESENKQVKPKGYWFYNHVVDGQLPLKQNAKYLEVMLKIENNTASLDECIYAQKCFSARRDGKPYAKIDDYIRKLSK